MSEQLQLGLDDQPRARRQAEPESFHIRSAVTPAEALEGDARAHGQDERVLRVFRESPRSARYTPSEVHAALVLEMAAAAPLLTSVRRSLTNLTNRGELVHHPEDRRPGPRGARESTWGLA